MKKECAEHLTLLFRRSAPITVSYPPDDHKDGHRNPTWTQKSLKWEDILAIIEPIALAAMPAALDEEIRAAARERREASGYACHVSYASANSVSWHPYGGFAMILWDMCRPQVEAAIAADNAVRLAKYEAYRRRANRG